ncbi:MAG: DUF692 family protein [Anaerolineae bacterium]|jgi:uncharacterized protein (UPF0276 family)|nr:DUF692 family protein [Anaerolineae bacterium]
MEFAINYSPQAADLLRRGAITLDRFKCPNWPDLLAEAREYLPVYVHFNFRAGPGEMAAADWTNVTAVRAQTNTPYVNLHLSPQSEHFPDIPLDSTDLQHVTFLTERMIADVAAAVEQVGAERVIVENVPYWAGHGPTLRPAIEPDVIRRVVDETGCGFLLDISHARISAHYTGVDPYEYLARLPCERLRELHITGIWHDEAGRWRDHQGMTEADWPFLAWVLDRIRSGEWARPWALAFEYGGIGPKFEWRSESGVIAEQVPRLVDMAHSV